MEINYIFNTVSVKTNCHLVVKVWGRAEIYSDGDIQLGCKMRPFIRTLTAFQSVFALLNLVPPHSMGQSGAGFGRSGPHGAPHFVPDAAPREARCNWLPVTADRYMEKRHTLFSLFLKLSEVPT